MALIFIVTAIICNQIIRNNTKNEWSEQLETLTLILSEHVSQTMFSGVTTLDSIANLVKNANIANEKEYRNFASSEVQHKLLVEKTFGNPIIDVTTFVSNQGEVLNFSRSFPPPKINLSNRDYFKWLSTNNTPDIYYSEPVRNKGNGKWVFYLARRINNNRGEFLGLALVGISAETFSDFYQKLGANLGPGSSVSLYRDDFTLMTRWPFKDDLIGQKNLSSATKNIIFDQNKNHGVLLTDAPRFTAGNATEPRMVATRSIEKYPFISTVVIQESVYNPQWFKGLMWIWSSLIFGLSLLFISMWFLLRANKKIGQELTGRISAQRALTASHGELKKIAYKDLLTGLPNRQKFIEDLALLTANPNAHPTYSSLIFINLDNFKILNDRFGNERGDLLLIEVAKQLVECSEQGIRAYRIGGDEFTILVSHSHLDSFAALIGAEQLAQKILTQFSKIYRLDGIEYRNGASMGISVFLNNGSQIDEVIKEASIALLESKLAGKNIFKTFTADMKQAIDRQSKLVDELKHAIDNQQLQLHYQAQFDQDLNLIGAEALLRWHLPGIGNISPDIFIPIAEKNGLIQIIGDWALHEALNTLASWSKNSHLNHLVLALNMNAQQIQMDNFTDTAMRALQERGLAPEKLKLELTESLLITNFEVVSQKMRELKSFGIKLALDDFGTGYSSLSYLKYLALDQLKIDKSFIRDLLFDKNDAAIIRTIITLGKSLGLNVIAEGVETNEQFLFLSALGCNCFQGFFLSSPLSEMEFNTFVLNYQSKLN